jgi:predicted short-subunit dehydrogenase-like oxidoreductase (DUF2520 family)
MIQVVILGTGNVATHLINAFENASNVEVVQVFNRNNSGFEKLSFNGNTTTEISKLMNADCYIIAVPDDAVQTLSASIPFENKLVVHTSGSVSIGELDPKNRCGVFYPLQTFSRDREVDFSEIPVCIEADNSADLKVLSTLALSVTKSVFEVNSDKRKQLHLAAVFVCNFVNHLYHIGYELTENNGIPFSILKPLIKETASKIEQASPEAMQTGPAKRNDVKTIEKHLNLLEQPLQKEIYKLLSQSIQKTYGREKL